MATALLPVVTVPVTASVAAPVTTPVVHVTVDAYDDATGNEVPALADAWDSDEAGEPYESDSDSDSDKGMPPLIELPDLDSRYVPV
ncbi:hypothetical protein C8J56DRAFT_1052204 [Mycena floridula]|nr:hypothetical protein C8J56DRAFT_1052204 [Mycena floridula]